MSDQRRGPLERITETGLIAVLRAIDPAQVSAVVDALVAAGVSVIEFTADSPNAFEVIRRERKRVGDRAAIGVGTVLDEPTAKDGLDAGAAFVVTPTVEVDVIDRCGYAGVPVIVGAYTPTEAVRAADHGADMIKIFPATTGGPAHIRAFGGPLDHLSLIPTGGVTVDTAGEYIAHGATAVGMGGGLFPDGALDAERYAEITARAEAVLSAIDAVR